MNFLREECFRLNSANEIEKIQKNPRNCRKISRILSRENQSFFSVHYFSPSRRLSRYFYNILYGVHGIHFEVHIEFCFFFVFFFLTDI